jgi:hypothetical protein
MSETPKTTKERQVLAAAYLWWKGHRPIHYSEADHLNAPVINTTTDTDKTLAIAVAELVRG